MNEIEQNPEFLQTLEELRKEVRRIRYLFSISIIVLALVLMFVAPVVIRSYSDYSSVSDRYTPSLDTKKAMTPRNMMMATSTASSTQQVGTTTVKK
jgi:hypothetical protein